MNIIQNFNEIINKQSNPNFQGKQGLVVNNCRRAAKNPALVTAIPTAALLLAIQNGTTAQDVPFTKQQIEEIFGNKEAFKLTTGSSNGFCNIHINSEFGNKEWINVCTIRCDENTNMVKNVYYDTLINSLYEQKTAFIVSIMENLSEDEQNLFFNSKLFNIKKPEGPIDKIKEKVVDAIKNTPKRLFYPLPDAKLVHSSDLINPNDLRRMEFGKDYLLMVHDTHNPEITALVKKEGLKCCSDVNPAIVAAHRNANNDPDLIYFAPLTPDYVIDENSIVIAVREGAGVVFNQEWRPVGFYNPYVILCHKFNINDCLNINLFPQTYRDFTVNNIPEICYTDKHIPPEYFVDSSKLKNLF